MTPRLVATIAAIAGLVFGAVGLAVPGLFASGFGMTFDPAATALARLASSSYIGFAVLTWLARDLTDPAAWRAVAAANAAAWAIGAVVVAITVASGIGDARTWVLVAMQVVFAVAWSMTYGRAARATVPAA